MRRGTDFDILNKERIIQERQAQSAQPGFWDDPQRAAAHEQATESLIQTVQRWNDLKKEAQELAEWQEMLNITDIDEMHTTDSLVREWLERAQQVIHTFVTHERDLLLSGTYDARPAILEIKAGTGGSDAMDWASMVLRMYVRFAEQQKFDCDIQHESRGEAGTKSATVRIDGQDAYGLMKTEHGSHRLVRRSPFNANDLRQTSFVAVDVYPEMSSKEIHIEPGDLHIDTYRASGAGGQHVNKTESAIRITHIPSGIVVTSQNQRSQHQNKESAMNMLAAKLMQQEEERQAQERAQAGGTATKASWGNRIRSYVMHPYKLVKDHRTNVETADVDAVLNGDLMPFIDAELRRRHAADNSSHQAT